VIAALYVDVLRGPYAGMADVDAWGVERDATLYAGPWAVVAHPPCGHWGRYWYKAHDDGHTGPIAVAQVRKHGGVLEHPRDSKLWREGRMPLPGWLPDAWGGYTIEVFQHDWGHRADKATWLYIVGVKPENLPPMPPHLPPVESNIPKRRTLKEGATRHGDVIRGMIERMPKSQRHLTPPAFAAWLVEVARRVTYTRTPGAE